MKVERGHIMEKVFVSKEEVSKSSGKNRNSLLKIMKHWREMRTKNE